MKNFKVEVHYDNEFGHQCSFIFEREASSFNDILVQFVKNGYVVRVQGEAIPWHRVTKLVSL